MQPICYGSAVSLERIFDFFLKIAPHCICLSKYSVFIFSGCISDCGGGSRLGDVAVYVKGVTGGTVLTMLALLFFVSVSRVFPGAVFIIYWAVILIFVSFSRFFFSGCWDEWVSRGNRKR